MGNNQSVSSASEMGLKPAYDVDNYPARLAPARSHRERFNRIGWRLISLFLTLASIACATIPNAFGTDPSEYSSWIVTDFSAYWFLVLFWDIFVLAWEKDRKQAIHPGAVVGMDLVIWLYSIGAWVIAILPVISFTNMTGYQSPDSVYELTPDQLVNTTICFAFFIGLTAACTLIHFGLFVVGCKQVHRHEKAVKAISAGEAVFAADSSVPAAPKTCTCACTCGAREMPTAQSSVRTTSTHPRLSTLSVPQKVVFEGDNVEHMDEKELLKARNW